MCNVRMDYLALGVLFAALIFDVMLIVFIIVTGSTYGQICSTSGFVGVEKYQCVQNLKYGNLHDLL